MTPWRFWSIRSSALPSVATTPRRYLGVGLELSSEKQGNNEFEIRARFSKERCFLQAAHMAGGVPLSFVVPYKHLKNRINSLYAGKGNRLYLI